MTRNFVFKAGHACLWTFYMKPLNTVWIWISSWCLSITLQEKGNNIFCAKKALCKKNCVGKEKPFVNAHWNDKWSRKCCSISLATPSQMNCGRNTWILRTKSLRTFSWVIFRVEGSWLSYTRVEGDRMQTNILATLTYVYSRNISEILLRTFWALNKACFFCCSKKYGYSQSLLVPSVLPLAHELLNQRGVQVWDPGRRQEAGRDRRPHRRHPLLHRRHHPLSLHSQNMQQEKKKEAGER